MPYFVIASLLSILLTFLVRKAALFFNVVDSPNSGRKKHSGNVPLLGGIAIFISFWLVVGYIIFFTNLFGKNLHSHELLGVFIASLLLLILGALDDKYSLSAKTRLMASVILILAAIAGGVGLNKITNPFGGVLFLKSFTISLGSWGTIFIVADALVFLWILGMMYTTKVLDGLDGLSTGISAIAAFMIFFVANGERWHQPDVALFSLVFAGACLGFLLFNFYPASIFLGEGGSLFLGFMLGILSVIAGGKIATALLVMAIPVLDLARVIYIRLRRRQPVFEGDREHLHFFLLDSGVSHRQAVLALYGVAILFGATTLMLQSLGKLVMLIILAGIMAVLTVVVSKIRK